MSNIVDDSNQFLFRDFAIFSHQNSDVRLPEADLEKRDAKVYELSLKIINVLEQGQQILDKRTDSWMEGYEAKVIFGLDLLDEHFATLENPSMNDLLDYVKYSVKACQNQLSPKLSAEFQRSPVLEHQLFDLFLNMEDGEERNRGLSICCYLGIGTQRNLIVAESFAEAGQGEFFCRSALLRHVTILEELVDEPTLSSDKKEECQRKLFELYELGERENIPELMVRYAWRIYLRDEYHYFDGIYALGELLMMSESQDNIEKGILLHRYAAKYKGGKSLHRLGLGYETGYFFPRELALAFQFYKQADEQSGDSQAAFSLAKCYLNGLGTDADETKALYYAEIALSKGIDEAHIFLGDLYTKGNSIKPDESKAYHHYLAAYEKKVEEGLENYARCLLEGIGVKPNVEEGMKLLQGSDSAKSKVVLAQFFAKKGKYQNLIKRDILLLKAASESNVDAMFELGFVSYQVVSLRGLSAKEDLMKMRTHWEMAIGHGSVNAHFHLGKFYAGFNQPALAIHHFGLGVQHEDRNCAMILGNAYLNGAEWCAQKNIALGVDHLEKAASWGSKQARIILLNHYMKVGNKEKGYQHLDFLLGCSYNSPDIAFGSALILQKFDFGHRGDAIDAQKIIRALIEMVQNEPVKYEQYKDKLGEWNQTLKKLNDMIELTKKYKTDLAASVYPGFIAHNGKTLSEAIEEVKSETEEELTRVTMPKAIIARLKQLHESYFTDELKKVDPDMEKQHRKIAQGITTECEDLVQARINTPNLQRFPAFISKIQTSMTIINKYQNKEKIAKMRDDWEIIKNELILEDVNRKLRMKQKELTSNFKAQKEGEVVNKVEQMELQLAQKKKNIEEQFVHFKAQLSAFETRSFEMIDRNESTVEIKEEIEELTGKTIKSLNATLKPPIISPSTNGNEELRGQLAEATKKLTDAVRSNEELSKELHNVKRETQQAQDQAQRRLDEQKAESEKRLQDQQAVIDRLREENNQFKNAIRYEKITGSVPVLANKINDKISELRIRSITEVRNYKLNTLPGKITGNTIRDILLGLGFNESMPSTGGSHRTYTRGTEAMQLSVHSLGHEPDDAQIELGLKFLWKAIKHIGG